MKLAFAASLAAVLALSGVGCSSKDRVPRKAYVDLQKAKQQDEAELIRLRRENEGLQQSVAQLSVSTTGPTTQSITVADLATIHAISLGRLTGFSDLDRTGGIDGLKVNFRTEDDKGDTLKVTGDIVVEAFDLTAKDVRIGRWEFTRAESRGLWFESPLLWGYVIHCPWQGEAPKAKKLLVKVTFTDALTGRTYEGSREVTEPSPTTTRRAS